MSEGFLGYRLLLLVAIVVVNGYFAAAEVSLVSVRKSRLRHLAEQGNVGAQAALQLLANPERLLSVTQFGVTLASLMLGWAGEDALFLLVSRPLEPLLSPALKGVLHGVSFAFAFLVMSFAHAIVGEVVPKNLALEKADRLAVLVAPGLLIFDRITRPVVFLLEKAATYASRLIGLRGIAHGGGHSPEELKFVVTTAREEGYLHQAQENAIQRILDLQDVLVREIMVPRNAVASIAIDATLDQVLRAFMDHQYSRLPVYQGRPENIIGVVTYKDLLPVWEERRLANERRRLPRPFRLATLLRKPLVVPETKPVNLLLDDFRRTHLHLGTVVDEFGTIVGIVTLEDVFEQVFGEIEDEHDEKRQMPTAEATVLELDGATPILDLETLYGIQVPTDAGFETLAGFLLYELGHIPQPGETVEHGFKRFTVLERNHNRIARVRIEKLEQPAPVTES